MDDESQVSEKKSALMTLYFYPSNEKRRPIDLDYQLENVNDYVEMQIIISRNRKLIIGCPFISSHSITP